MSKITQNEIEQNLLNGWISVSGSWAYASADAPTFTITVPSGASSIYGVGMRIKLTQTTVKYFIITAVADMVLTVYGGTDYTLANAAISSISYSTQKAPLGFPLNPSKWTQEFRGTAQTAQNTPTANTWYNIGTYLLSVPIGCWRLSYKTVAGGYKGSTMQISISTTLSTANNSESDTDFSVNNIMEGATGTLSVYTLRYAEKYISLSSKATYYLNCRSTTASMASIIETVGDPTIIRAVCAYL